MIYLVCFFIALGLLAMFFDEGSNVFSTQSLLALSNENGSITGVGSCTTGHLSGKTNSNKIVLPIQLAVDPMERLIVVSFKGDSEFEMFEPQMFYDPINGKGLRIIRYRKDKRVDVYWQPGVFVDRNSFNLGAGLGDFAETEMSPSCFEFTGFGVNVEIAFTDIQGRKVELFIRENSSNINRSPFLAPVGKDIDDPKQFFLAYMHGFDFVKKTGTFFHAEIGGRLLVPSSFPIIRNFKRVFFIRYSTHPVTGIMNPPMVKPIEFDLDSPGCKSTNGMNVYVNESNRVEKMCAGDGIERVEMRFSPAFPSLLDLCNDEIVSGHWTFSISDDSITGGKYCLLRKGEKVKVEFDVTQHWKPSKLPFGFKMLTIIIRSFCKWPSTYTWKGTVMLGDELSLEGEWKRKK